MGNEWLSSHLPTSGTLSKSPFAWGLTKDVSVSYGERALVMVHDWKDPLGRLVLDWVSGLGANLFGYGEPGFNQAVASQLYHGAGFSLPHRLEHETATRLAYDLGENVPGWSPDSTGVRFCKTGSEATTMAIRLARAVTDRRRVVTFKGHYHGWNDWALSRTDPAWGLPYQDQMVKRTDWAGVSALEWGDQEAVKRLQHGDVGIAAVIFEIGIDDPGREWLGFLRSFCDERGALLVVDEIVTGLRYGVGGACQRYEILPDLVCVGKALGNGLPINAVVGRAEYLDWFARNDPVFCSSTHWGEAVSLAAANWVLTNWDEAKVQRLWSSGGDLMTALGKAGWSVIGHPPRSLLVFKNEIEKAFFIQGMWERGIMMNRPNFPTLAHTSREVNITGAAAASVREEMEGLSSEALARRVEGKRPRELFTRR